MGGIYELSEMLIDAEIEVLRWLRRLLTMPQSAALCLDG